jgi:rSAM/selenodomain-associated transferase 1
MTGPSTVIVLAKAPQAGATKTRLTPPCTPQQAAALAEAALVDTLAAVAASAVDRRVLVIDGAAGDWLPAGFGVLPQRGAGLGERLEAAYADVLGPRDHAPTLLVGMDTPQLTADLIEASLAALCRPGVDAVLGDALDGGYWAVGLHRPAPRAFAGVPMSRPDTGLLQRRRLASLGLAVRDLPALRDVDRWPDVLEVAAAAPQSMFARTVASVRSALDGQAPERRSNGSGAPLTVTRIE